jgi:uncharacterized protein (TIGR03435 family)
LMAALVAALVPEACYGQGTGPEFAAASLKRVDYRAATEGLVETPASFSCTCRLAVLIRRAYQIDPLQLAGQPSWFRNQLYQVAANLPEGAMRDPIPVMLRQLLAERLHLAVHWEDRETPVYALVVGKGGLKLKRPGEPGSVGLSRPRFVLGLYNRMHYEAAVPLANLASLLSPLLDRRVVDETGMEGRFEMVLDATVLRRPLPVLAGGPEPDPTLSTGGATADAPPSIFSAIQKLGLKLEPVRRPIKYLVVDRVDRDPIDN